MRGGRRGRPKPELGAANWGRGIGIRSTLMNRMEKKSLRWAERSRILSVRSVSHMGLPKRKWKGSTGDYASMGVMSPQKKTRQLRETHSSLKNQHSPYTSDFWRVKFREKRKGRRRSGLSSEKTPTPTPGAKNLLGAFERRRKERIALSKSRTKHEAGRFEFQGHSSFEKKGI